MFVDKVLVSVKAGDGGNGAVSFRHEKFIDRGGPDGGDGGKGGDIILLASYNQNTLANFRYKKLLKAEDGQAGSKQKKHGKNGKDFPVSVPVGTVVIDSSGTVLADLTTDGSSSVIAKGGQGGFGNAHFVSSRRQAPRVAEKGEQTDEQELTLELKMIADVGLVGLPNAGKSTLLASISNARPEIANYPFTTLTPNLGVVDIDSKHSILLADIPGLIEGASQGKGLGDEFLRHIERTKILFHLVDVYQNDIAGTYTTIQKELKDYKIDLSKRPQIVVLTKVEGMDEDILNDRLAELRAVVPAKTVVMAISAKSKQGLKELLTTAQKLLTKRASQQKTKDTTETLPIITLEDDDGWQIAKKGKGFEVKGSKIERFAGRTDFENPHSVARLRDIMKKMGIFHELVRHNIESGQSIYIGKYGPIKY